MDEAALLRRIMEVCTTLETGRWNGKASIAMLDDDGTLSKCGDSYAALQKAMASVAAAQSASKTATATPAATSSTRRGRKKSSAQTTATAASTAAAAAAQNNSLAAAQAMVSVDGHCIKSQLAKFAA